jgi:hypothetical protein
MTPEPLRPGSRDASALIVPSCRIPWRARLARRVRWYREASRSHAGRRASCALRCWRRSRHADDRFFEPAGCSARPGSGPAPETILMLLPRPPAGEAVTTMSSVSKAFAIGIRLSSASWRASPCRQSLRRDRHRHGAWSVRFTEAPLLGVPKRIGPAAACVW